MYVILIQYRYEGLLFMRKGQFARQTVSNKQGSSLLECQSFLILSRNNKVIWELVGLKGEVGQYHPSTYWFDIFVESFNIRFQSRYTTMLIHFGFVRSDPFGEGIDLVSSKLLPAIQYVLCPQKWSDDVCAWVCVLKSSLYFTLKAKRVSWCRFSWFIMPDTVALASCSRIEPDWCIYLATASYPRVTWPHAWQPGI